MNLIDLNPQTETEETYQTTASTNQLKLLMEGKYVEPKKPEPSKSNILKKKFKVNLDDLPTI